MARWKAVGAAAGLLSFVFVFMPVRYREVCGFDRGGVHFPRPCYNQYESIAGIDVHPIVSVFLGMCLVLVAFVWLYRRPSPPFVNRLMEGRGWRYSVLRWLVYIGIGVVIAGVFFVAPLWVLGRFDAPGTSWTDWAPMALIVALWTFLIAFGPSNVRGKPWHGHRHPSVFVGPEREPPPDSRRY